MSSCSDEVFGFELSQALTIQTSAIIVETIIYGFYIGVFILSTWFIIRKGIWTRANQFMLAITSAMFMVASTHWGLSVRYTMLIVQTQSQRVSANYKPQSNYTPALLITQAVHVNLSLVMFILNDVVVVWRAWLLCGRKGRRLVCIVSLLALVGEISLAVFNLAKLPSIWNYLLEQMVVERTFQVLNTLEVLTPMYIACSVPVFINIGATIVITYKAWVHRRLIREINQRDTTLATKVLFVFVESGAIYCLVWVAFMAFFFARTFNPAVVRDPNNWTEVFYADAGLCMVHTAGIYPTILVVLVCLKKTFHENLALFPHDISIPPVLRDAKSKTVAPQGSEEISSDPELHHISIISLHPQAPSTRTQTDGRLASVIQIDDSFDSD